MKSYKELRIQLGPVQSIVELIFLWINWAFLEYFIFLLLGVLHGQCDSNYHKYCEGI